MSSLAYLGENDVRPAAILRARVIDVIGPGWVWVSGEEESGDHILCAILQTGEEARLQLVRGDTVLIWQGAGDERGVVLGRIAPRPAAFVAPVEPPDEIVIEAKQQLTFKCGEGSITLRGDGKVLIKGKDLVSHAQRANRIKGGSVAIN